MQQVYATVTEKIKLNHEDKLSLNEKQPGERVSFLAFLRFLGYGTGMTGGTSNVNLFFQKYQMSDHHHHRGKHGVIPML